MSGRRKSAWQEEEITCKPLDTLEDIKRFLENPPPWRTLCRELTPHSRFMIKNSEINKHFTTSLETPETFCHFDPDAEDVIRHVTDSLPKTLVCHDMANGYHDDSYIDGTAEYDAYTFYNWAGIDIFCYFSHHLITIPPLGWINVGHDHGVKVIGTVISEWAEGILFWDKILESEKTYRDFASALVAITKTLKFDGWLLNVENKISKPDMLLEFVIHLNLILHQEIPHAVLIWYDSVTINGSLNWQNGLNEKNKAFFDACDGLFTNYSWVEKDVNESALAAGDRITDLYIGIDVWGRNFHGGGQFNTQEAVKVAHQLGCSLAIFAPAWTHEAMSTDKCDVNAVAMAEGLDFCQQSLLRDRALWGSLWPFLNTRLPCALPFKTSFCRGMGRKRRMYGEVLSNTPWYNLRHQQYQPNSAHGPHGYLLSTHDAILQHSCNAIKGGKGILRYPGSFRASRMDLHSTARRHRDSLLVPRADSLTAVDEGDEGSEEPDEPRRPRTTFFRRLQRKLMAPHADEPDAPEEQGPSASTSADAERGSLCADRGKSMMQMSVNVNLSAKGRRRRWALAHVPEERECLELYPEDAFVGGACLRISPADGLCGEHRLTRLFHCDFRCEDSLVVCVVTKKLVGYGEQYLNIELAVKTASSDDLSVVLIGRSVPHSEPVRGRGASAGGGVRNVLALRPSGSAFRDLQRYLLLNRAGFYVPIENSFDWKVRYYEVHLPGARVTSINCRTGYEQGAVLLGHLGICHRTPENQ